MSYAERVQKKGHYPLDRFFAGTLKTAWKEKQADALCSPGSDGAVEAGSLRAAACRGARDQAASLGQGADRAVPVPRRPQSQPEHRPGEKCVELQRRLRRGRRCVPVGDAGRGGELPSRAGAAAERLRSIGGAGGEDRHRAEAAAVDRRHGGRQKATANRSGLLPSDAERCAGGAAVSHQARPSIRGDHRPFQAGLCQPFAVPASAGVEPRRRRGSADAVERAWHPAQPEAWARALQWFAGYPHLQSGRRSGRDVRAEDDAEVAPRHAGPHVSSGSAPWGVERRSPHRIEGNHPVRSVDRRAYVLGCGLPQCHGQLRRERLHSRPSRGLREARHRAGLHRIRPRRSRRQSRSEAGRRVDEHGNRMLPCAVPSGPGRQRIRTQNKASGEGAGRLADRRGVDGQRPTASGPCAHAGDRGRANGSGGANHRAVANRSKKHS